MGPTVEEEVRRLGAQGVSELVVVPLSFLFEQRGTLYLQVGTPCLARAECSRRCESAPVATSSDVRKPKRNSSGRSSSVQKSEVSVNTVSVAVPLRGTTVPMVETYLATKMKHERFDGRGRVKLKANGMKLGLGRQKVGAKPPQVLH